MENTKKTGGLKDKTIYYKTKILEYLSNPENDWLDNAKLCRDVLNIARMTLYRHFSLEEIEEIKKDALKDRTKNYDEMIMVRLQNREHILALRRAKYVHELEECDKALLEKAKGGDVKAIELCYQRFEGWVKGQKIEFEGDLGFKVEVIKFSDEGELTSGEDTYPE